MESYESLYKDFVKNPYRLSNKKNVEVQIMQIVSIRYYGYYAILCLITEKNLL